jgi:hypothetical protein
MLTAAGPVPIEETQFKWGITELLLGSFEEKL